ncbi:hypothetical protein Taro_032818 [Colocasia esculenta]|uniref:Aminotransferase-like plant mobile domain-containing protein n=1 Tax=Colocasia esculenta TaxID=4460 RepID=A0A843VYC4_COLES|nr:hypothetical protein [Colocasia esculenta]
MAAASPADSAEGSGEGSTSVAGDELALVPATTATGRGGGATAMEDPPATSGGSGGDDAAAEEEDATARHHRGRQGRDLPARTEIGHMVPSLEDVARITGLRVNGEAVTGVTYADYTDLTLQLLGLEPFGQDDHERRMDNEDTVRADRDLRRFLVFFFGKMLFTTKGDGIHCRFLELLDDLTRVGRYAWGAALLAHTFADLSTGTGRETIVGGFAPFLQVWSYYYLPLGRATEVDPTVVPFARRWLPLVSTATYAFQLDVLRLHVRDFPALLVVWEPYAGYGDADQPWVVSGRGLFRRDIWVHCLNEIEPLRLRLAARTLGLHQRWIDEVVTSDATDSTAYLQRYQEEYGLRDFMRPERDGRDTLIGQLEGQLVATTAQLAEARAALKTLRTAQGAAVQAEAGGASSSRGPAVAAEVSSLQEQLAAAVARAERAERDLAIRSEELESALARETLTVAELTEQRSQPTPTELPRDVAELRALLALERRDLERQQSQWEREQERLTQQAVEARAGQLAAERLLKASEERYRRGRERAREQGRASAYSESVLASSSQYERNVQDAAGAERSTGSRAPMGPPPPPTTVADLGEAESSQREPATPAEGGDESQTTSP